MNTLIRFPIINSFDGVVEIKVSELSSDQRRVQVTMSIPSLELLVTSNEVQCTLLDAQFFVDVLRALYDGLDVGKPIS